MGHLPEETRWESEHRLAVNLSKLRGRRVKAKLGTVRNKNKNGVCEWKMVGLISEAEQSIFLTCSPLGLV